MSTFWRAFLLGAMSGMMGRHLSSYALWKLMDRQLAAAGRRRRCPTCRRY
jgi:hypothetical protein